ncbi:MAG: glycosyltransferase family 4 protein [Bacteroidetes bacterium]|nr:glycosyltransferase family 4 protein [Bacteroidota bacterium]
MKVLQVIPYMETKYGGPVFVATMISYFLNIGNIENKILSAYSLQAKKNSNVITYKKTSRFWFFSIDFLLNAHKEVKDCDCLLVHGVYSFFTFWTYVLALVYRKKIFLRPAGMLDVDSVFDGYKFKTLARLIYLIATGLFIYLISCKVIFNSSKEKCNSLLGFTRKAIILSNGIDPNIVNVKPKSKLFNKPYKLFFMGRLDPIKGIDLLIKAVKNLDAEIKKDVELIVAGDGRHDFVKRIKSQSCNNINYIGHIEGELKYQYLKECDIYLQPSKTEGLSNSMLEAMFCQVAIITTKNVGLACELIEKDAAEVIDFDVAELTRSITKLIKSKELVKRYKVNSFRFASKSYNFEKNIYNYIDIFKEPC